MFSTLSEAWGNDNKSDETKTSKKKYPPEKSDSISLSLMSDYNDSDKSYAPINFSKFYKKKKHTPVQSECSDSISHINKCDDCYNKLKKLVNTRVNEKFDQMLLDKKIDELKSLTPTATNSNSNYNSNYNDRSKEIIIIILIVIIVVLIMFFLMKLFQK